MTAKFPKFEKGVKLAYSESARSELSGAMQRLIREMQADVMVELKELYKKDLIERQLEEMGIAIAMDASLADMVGALITRLSEKWLPRFDTAALTLGDNMVDRALGQSNRQLSTSLKSIGEKLTLDVTPELRGRMDASAQEAAALIKRVPAEYLPNVQQDVMRSITTGNGLQDLIPKLRERNVKVRNWAENVARDQTRKAYATINRTRMEETGIEEFEWIHSGGSNQPRPHHLKKFPAGLNGGIFRFDDPPIIDERTGEKGFPGQAPYCGCTMRPVIRFKKDTENETS